VGSNSEHVLFTSLPMSWRVFCDISYFPDNNFGKYGKNKLLKYSGYVCHAAGKMYYVSYNSQNTKNRL
jgi:hypothetical protein